MPTSMSCFVGRSTRAAFHNLPVGNSLVWSVIRRKSSGMFAPRRYAAGCGRLFPVRPTACEWLSFPRALTISKMFFRTRGSRIL